MNGGLATFPGKQICPTRPTARGGGCPAMGRAQAPRTCAVRRAAILKCGVALHKGARGWAGICGIQEVRRE